ncbi:MAG: hypothetical protein AAGA08_19870 [Pseudomonadota bacterium]
MRTLIAAAVVAIWALPATAEQVYFGYWDGGKPKEFPSTIEFLADKKLAYCIKNDCRVYKYSGSSKRKFKFKTKGGRWSYKRLNASTLQGSFVRDAGDKYNIVMRLR